MCSRSCNSSAKIATCRILLVAKSEMYYNRRIEEVDEMEFCKLQVCCLIIIFYIISVYWRERRRIEPKYSFRLFDGLLAVSVICLSFDGITAYTVNHLETVSPWFNHFAHFIFLISVDATIFLLFLYILVSTESMPETRKRKVLLTAPFIVNVAIVMWNMDTLSYRKGVITNYSMGISVYTCFAMAAIYMALTLIVFFRKWNYMESHKRACIFIYILVLVVATTYQMLVPEALITSIGFTIIIIGIYVNQEDPAIRELAQFHREMVTGFATLVENRDDSTGGHIRRTSRYVELLAKELRKRGYYKDVLTKDYITNLKMAAPMHDIGKIAVPDSILQKPGKLTDEEFATMQMHTTQGAAMIQDTFGHMGNVEYRNMAYEVALYHHEKWNGKGYPTGIRETQIPLCARIMAVADVFDAVSEKRCYRDAMPLDKCFAIIREGGGRDFEPLLAEVFLEMRDKVERVHREVNEKRGDEGK